mmetsp:Transcript_22394/g.34516  ORF Transcript_22394/g.34516 Transcript_22394/m.34516 type:complete len:301 (-) Transcript_22394:100-1002(-)
MIPGELVVLSETIQGKNNPSRLTRGSLCKIQRRDSNNHVYLDPITTAPSWPGSNQTRVGRDETGNDDRTWSDVDMEGFLHVEIECVKSAQRSTYDLLHSVVSDSHDTLNGTLPYQNIMELMEKLWIPADIARYIASFLVVEKVDFQNVEVTSASSTRGDYPLSSVLSNKPHTWWISGTGGITSGRGEYIEFRLEQNGGIRRLHLVGLSIPALPTGPLSARNFRIDWSMEGKEWINGDGTTAFETMDKNGIQIFELPSPIDAAYVRLVCLDNVIHALGKQYSDRILPEEYDCVGLYHVRLA